MPKKKTVCFNPYQQAVVNFRNGYAVAVAAPGSGKTEVVIRRIQALLSEGVNPKDILSLTFTKEGSREMTDRADLDCAEKVFSTFHSWALAFIKREGLALPFKVKTDFHGNPAPLCLPIDACRTLAQICRHLHGVKWKDAQGFISKMKRRGVSPAMAMRAVENDGEIPFIEAYKRYDAALREKGVMDFDSIVIETANLLRNRDDVRDRNQFKFVQVDEAQDTDAVQWSIIKALTLKHGNALAVGDENQCQPPETMITDYSGKQVRLGDLCEHNQVRSWTKTEQRVYKQGRKIKVARRWYRGPLLTIVVGDKKTRMTPGHQLWVRFTDAARGSRIVYLMWRSDLGFRVGTTWLRNKHGQSMFLHRGLVEKAEKLWILSVEENGMAAQAKEQMVTVKYGIPYSGFEPPYTPIALHEGNGRDHVTIKKIFACANPNGGFACLQDHGRSWEHPFVEWPKGMKLRPHGYFKTTAANLLPRLMSIPTPEINGSHVVDAVDSEPYEGLVCSLDVDKDHTYIADGVVVGNCMYTWRGAAGNLTEAFKELFPEARVFPLPVNYRSTREIVQYCQEIAPIRNETILNLSTPNEVGVPIVYRLYGREDEEAAAVIGGCMDLGNTAILARTNRQLAAFENECGNRNLRYKLLGKSGFWGQHEVRDVLAIVGSVIFPNDTNILRMLGARCEATKFIRKADTHAHKGVPSLLKEMQEQEPEGTTIGSLLMRYQGDGMQAVRDIVYTMRELRGEINNLDGTTGMNRILNRFGVLSAYDEDDDKDENVDNDPRENIMKLVEYAGRKGSVRGFYEWTGKVQRALRARTNALTLGTVHAAKGKEWDQVHVTGVNQDVLPHIKGELEEEKRIFFVACSRARKRLLISASGVPSPFIKDKLPDEQRGTIDPWEGFSLLQR